MSLRRSRRRSPLVALAFAGPTLLAAASASAAVPQKITHQGRLYDSAGVPVDDTLPVTFRLYNGAGAEVWSETHQIAYTDGYYAVELGTLTPLDLGLLATEPNLELGIQLANDPELTPRSPVNSVPFALVASDAVGDLHPTSITINGVGVGFGDWFWW